jgi:hypothetical protein
VSKYVTSEIYVIIGIFKQNYTKTEPSFVYYRNNQIQNVSEYTSLGISCITLKSNGNLSHSTTDYINS